MSSFEAPQGASCLFTPALNQSLALLVLGSISPFKGAEHEMKPKNVLRVGKSFQRLRALVRAVWNRDSVTTSPALFYALFCSLYLAGTILSRDQLCALFLCLILPHDNITMRRHRPPGMGGLG
jgi:hypothetical protein